MKASKHETVKAKPATRTVSQLRVRVASWAGGSPGKPIAFLRAGAVTLPCAIGRSGLTRRKREGDGATPIGVFGIPGWRFQAATPPFPRGSLHGKSSRRDDGWCDDPLSGAYNRQVRLPFRAGHEALWRDDGKYAVIGILDYNLAPRKRSAGSAIFFHFCDEAFGATAGCIAIRPNDFRKLQPMISRRTKIVIV